MVVDCAAGHYGSPPGEADRPAASAALSRQEVERGGARFPLSSSTMSHRSRPPRASRRGASMRGRGSPRPERGSPARLLRIAEPSTRSPPDGWSSRATPTWSPEVLEHRQERPVEGVNRRGRARRRSSLAATERTVDARARERGRDLVTHDEQGQQGACTFERAMSDPVVLELDGERQARSPRRRRARPSRSRPGCSRPSGPDEVVALPGHGGVLGEPGSAREREEPVRMRAAERGFLAGLAERRSSASSRIVSSIQKRSVVTNANEALVDERLERVEVGVADLFGGGKRAAAGEDGEPGEELLLGRLEQLVRPLDRRAKRLLALTRRRGRRAGGRGGWRAARAAARSRAPRSARRRARGRAAGRRGARRARRRPRRARSPAGRPGHGSRTARETRRGEHRDGDRRARLRFAAAHGSSPARRGSGSRASSWRQLRRSVDHVLEVVQQEQEPPLADRDSASPPLTPSARLAASRTPTRDPTTAASGTHHTPWGYSSAAAPAAWNASRVLPLPPGPVSVSEPRRPAREQRAEIG